MMTRRLGPALLCLLAVSCGGNDSLESPDDNPGGSGVPIRGGERIAWDQPADSASTARAHTYKLYVDGTPAPMSDVSCSDVRSGAGVACSGRLPTIAPGAHRLELTATMNGVESSRSAPLNVFVGSAAILDGTTSGRAPATPLESGTSVCLDGVPQQCYVSHLLASIEGSLTAPVAAANRVFFVEDGVRVRAVLDEALLAESSLEMDGHVASLALPPDFEQSHAVFVGWTEDRPGPSEILSVTRYREVRGILGEGATIVTGLPVPDGGIPLVAIDDQGLVYVALPAATSPIATAAATPRGSILRFDADGRVPAANPRTTPVVAQGYSTPSSLVFDGAGRQLWLAGSDPALASPVSQLPTDFERANEWPRRPMQIPTKDAQLSTPPGLAVLTTGAARHAWWIRRDGGAERGSISASAGAPFADRRGLGGISHIVAIAPGPSQDVILVTRAGGPSDPISTMWRLVPRSLQP